MPPIAGEEASPLYWYLRLPKGSGFTSGETEGLGFILPSVQAAKEINAENASTNAIAALNNFS